jgi:hypothetical protein
MKYSILGLAIVFAGSLLGCSDESGNVAGSTAPAVATDIAKPAPIVKSVNIKRTVKYPGKGLIIVGGQVFYTFFRTPASDEGIYSMEIVTNVKLETRRGDQVAQINDSDARYVSLHDAMGPIEKKYSLKGLSTTLHVRFILQASTLSVGDMWITADRAEVDDH